MSTSTETPIDLSSLSDAAVLLLFKDVNNRHGELEMKQFIASLHGIDMPIPKALTDQVELYGAEVFKRMQS